jgi:putative membrane protein
MPSERRLHPASMLFALWQQAQNLLLPGLVLVFGARRSDWGWETWAMLGFLPVALASLLHYLSYRYRYDATELVIRSGVLFRNERHVPYARIQNVDAVQGLLHRMLGVAEVRLQTGGGSEPEAVLRVLPLEAYEEMRQRVFGPARGPAPVEPAGAAPASGERLLLRLSGRELVLYGLIENRGTVVLGAAFGLLWELGLLDRLNDQVFGQGSSARGVVRDLLRALFGQGGLPVGKIALTLFAFAAFLVAMRLLSVAWALVRLHGFSLSLAGDELRTRYGLLTRVSATIPLRRIQTLSVREGPLHRLCGRAAVRVDTAGGPGHGPSEGQREWLLPLLRREELPRLLSLLLPEVDLERAAWQPPARGALRREFRRGLLLAGLACLGLVRMLGVWVLLLFGVLLVWAYLHARQYVRHLAHAVGPGAAALRSGWLWRETTLARLAKIQAVALHASPFDRRARMARLHVDTAGARDLGQRVQIPYLELERARSLFLELAGHAARTAFRW